MRPELIFHTEGFAAGGALAALASHRADVLLRQIPGVTRIRLLVIFERMPSGTGIYAARGYVDGPGSETVAIEVAHDPDTAILRVFARLGRQLAGRAAAAAPAP
ncbi:MAG TPA: hypothetical protein VLW52_09735 [Opitutaceae bacterium]|nr:hypothetical protein [Opitutaceae bacterium]